MLRGVSRNAVDNAVKRALLSIKVASLSALLPAAASLFWDLVPSDRRMVQGGCCG